MDLNKREYNPSLQRLIMVFKISDNHFFYSNCLNNIFASVLLDFFPIDGLWVNPMDWMAIFRWSGVPDS